MKRNIGGVANQNKSSIYRNIKTYTKYKTPKWIGLTVKEAERILMYYRYLASKYPEVDISHWESVTSEDLFKLSVRLGIDRIEKEKEDDMARRIERMNRRIERMNRRIEGILGRELQQPQTVIYAIKICMSWNSGVTSNLEGKEMMFGIVEESFKRNIDGMLLYDILCRALEDGEDIPCTKIRSRTRVVVGATIALRETQLLNDIHKYVDNCGASFVYCDYRVITSYNDVIKKWGAMKLYGMPLKLLEYCNLIDIEKGMNCVKTILKSVCDKKLYSEIDNLGDGDGVEIDELKEFATTNDVPINILNNLCVIEWSSVKNIDDKCFNIMGYNNHAYYFGRKLPRKNKQPTQVVIVDNCNNKLNEIIASGKMPYNIKIGNANEKRNEINVTSFMDDKYKYISNPEYIECHKILKLFGCENEITDGVSINHLTKIIEKKYIQDDISSFIPNIEAFAQSGYLYKRDHLDGERAITTEDMNKAYATALLNLPFITKCDWRTAEIKTDIQNQNIKDNNMYIIEADATNDKRGGIVLLTNNVYHGYHLKKCIVYGLKFTIKEEINTEIRANYYNPMINDMIKNIGWDYTRAVKSFKWVETENDEDDPLYWGCDGKRAITLTAVECEKQEKILKNMINIMIGTMRMSTNYVEKYKCLGIYNNDEVERHCGHIINLNEKFNIVYNVHGDVTNIKNKLPIHLQIINDVNMILFERLMNKNIKFDDIQQIKIDSVSYYGKPHNDYSDNVGGWKLEKYTELLYTPEHNNGNITFYVRNSFTDNRKIERVLYSVNAGNGKTTHIINHVIPRLNKNKKSFIVMAPTHKALEEYTKIDCNNDVITAYAYGNKSIGNVDYVIIDEIGLVGGICCEFLYKLSMTPINYICVGDWNQLNPVSGKQINTTHYNEYMYNTFETPKELQKNYRNDFTDEYYEKLKMGNYDNLNEIKKYSTKNYYDAECIICYRNDTVKLYNEKMLKHLNKTPTDVGVKYLCKTNTLKGLKNNNIVTIKDNTDGIITLSNDVQIKEKTILTQKFKLAFAVTIYSLQGAGVESYHWANEDDVLFKNGMWDVETMNKISYTIISRLKGEISKNT